MMQIPQRSFEKPAGKEKYQETEADVRSFISNPRFPCLAARGIAKRHDFIARDYSSSSTADWIEALVADLRSFTLEWNDRSEQYHSFIATFSDEPAMSEEEFESWLWRILSELSLHDSEEWDRSVSADPEDPDYSWSFAGEAFYIVGLHPGASRAARRFRSPALVFNRHRFFEQLREEGGYNRMRDLIRKRDREANGSVNPMLADFGTISEARQYAGRVVDEKWKCPFADHVQNRFENTQSNGGTDEPE